MSGPIELIKSVIPKRLSDEQFDKILTGPPHPVFIVDELRLRSDRAALRAENANLRAVVELVPDLLEVADGAYDIALEASGRQPDHAVVVLLRKVKEALTALDAEG